MSRKSRTSRWASLAVHAVLIGTAAMSAAPLLWMVCAAVKRPEDLGDSLFLPWGHLERLTLGHFKELFGHEPFVTWLVNSLFLASTYTVLVVSLSSLGGFALAKYRFAGKRVLQLVMLGTMLMPAQVLLPGSYQLMYRFGWINSYAAILVPGAVSVFGIFLFRQAMSAVPDELLQAGRVDGCSELRLWWDVALPIVRPMVGAYTLMSFLSAWNAFLWPQVILQDANKYTLPLGLASLQGLPQYQANYGLLMAATLVSIAPVVALFFAMQRDFVAGLASGAIKG